MGTRGLYGVRKNGKDMLTYNHWDSYPTGLGKDVFNFCRALDIKQLNMFADKLVMVQEDSKPTEEQIEICVSNGFYNDSVSTGSTTDWYCLLRNLQGEFGKYKALTLDENVTTIFMTDCSNFIQDSCFCEYGYIINLDEEVVEFWRGFQKTPDPDNRYGMQPYEGYSSTYYPCKMEVAFKLEAIHLLNAKELYDVCELLENECYNIIKNNYSNLVK